MFKKGDKVLCVDDNVKFPEWIIKGKLKNGCIYTIRNIDPFGKGVRVEEVEQIICEYHKVEKTFPKKRFVKLWDNKKLSEFKNKKELVEEGL